MCIYPTLIINKKYVANKKNNYNPPTMTDERVKYVPVGCGKCIECRTQKAREWRVRLQEEHKRATEKGYFITWTFSDEAIEELEKAIETESTGWIKYNEIATLGVRRYLEKWRRKHKKSVRHWMITEQGGEYGRIHIHGILWTEHEESIKERWGYGHVWIGEYRGEISVNYMTKYVLKTPEYDKDFIPKILCSKGIGRGYEETYNGKKNQYKPRGKTNETYRTEDGLKLALPIYYRNKIYSEYEREKLWLEKLDKEERWVCGERVDVSDNEEEYNKLVKWYREKNERLGYGGGRTDEEEEKYKSRKREIAWKTHVKKEKERINKVIKHSNRDEETVNKSKNDLEAILKKTSFEEDIGESIN